MRADSFYIKLIEDHTFDKNRKLYAKIHNINEHDLKEMDKFNSLCIIYEKINKFLIFADQNRCKKILQHLNQCIEQYGNVINDFPNECYTNFCKALYKFKEKYEEINNRIF
ncbi:hypothetical protein POWCR01_000079900 [Plasmodium ovale]|uniref:PIR protein n=1 Tax=Plasmodium ovale TaxID=36330 RepID=A0A1C3KH71_PLAOA|nr:hypothetical protein POWCR01_000079900 [Plasmodium ovale]